MFRNQWRENRLLLAGACVALGLTAVALAAQAGEAQTLPARPAASFSHRAYMPVVGGAPKKQPTATPVPPPSTGTIYYVAANGNDGSSGTEAQPWRTIQKAANTVGAGQTVYIKAGTYRERVTPKNSGSSGKYITYAAYPGQSVIVDAAGLVGNFQGAFDVSNKSYIRVSGLTVKNSAYANLFASSASNILFDHNHTLNSGNSGIGAWGGSNIVADSNDVENSNYGGGNEAISFGGVGGFEIKNNHVHNPNPTGGVSKEGIDAKQGSNNGKIHSNLVEHTTAVGIYVDAYDQHTYNIEVYDNIVHDASLGFVLASEAGGLLENIKHYNNVAYNIPNCGMRVFGQVETASHPMKNITLINNTVYNSGCGIDVSNNQVTAFVIRNNIVSRNGNQLQINVSVSLLTIDHNLIDGASSTMGSSYVQGNPMFMNTAGGDFRLQGGSPAVDKAMASSAPAWDQDGDARPRDGGYDIGAYEY